jgi:hypothetical protein
LDVSPEITVDDNEIQRILDLVLALKPIQTAVEALCRRDANLITVDAVLKFTLDKLQQQDSALALHLIDALSIRIRQRRTELSGVLKYLHTGEQESGISSECLFPSPSSSRICSVIKDLIKRLTAPNEERLPRDESQDPLQGPSRRGKTPRTDLQKELEMAIKEAVSSNHVEKPQP